MNIEQYSDYLIDWMELQRKHYYKMDGYTLGVSGGIDSAVCLLLAARTKRPVYAYLLPTAVNQSQDLEDAKLLLSQVNIPEQQISIQPMYDVVMESLAEHLNPQSERNNVIKGNLMARLRMVTLYTLAQSYQSIVIGTDNAAESYTGYFTKFGDGAADILPIAHLRKEQVYEMADYLGVPQVIIDKKPSAGLWEGQTDESEMGVSYAEIDCFLKGGTVSEEAQSKIDFWHQRSHHKRTLPLQPEQKPST